MLRKETIFQLILFVGKVYGRAKWPIQPEIVPVSIA